MANIKPQDLGFNLVINEIESGENASGRKWARSLVQIGPLPFGFTRLARVKDVKDEDKFTVELILTKDQRTALIDQLLPAALKVAEAKGLKVTAKEAEATLRKKIKEVDEGSGVYKITTEQRQAFRNEDGSPDFVTIKIISETGEELDKAYLENGSTGFVNFHLDATPAQTGKQVHFPFRLRAVKLLAPKYYEFDQGQSTSDFSAVDSNY